MSDFWQGFEKQANPIAGGIGGAFAGLVGAAFLADVFNKRDLNEIREVAKGHDARKIVDSIKHVAPGLRFATQSELRKKLETGNLLPLERQEIQHALTALDEAASPSFNSTSQGGRSLHNVYLRDEEHPSVIGHEIGHYLDYMKQRGVGEKAHEAFNRRSAMDHETAAWDLSPLPVDPKVKQLGLGTYDRFAKYPGRGAFAGALAGGALGALAHALRKK